MRRICILIDHPTRDLPGNILLAQELLKKKIKVFFVPSKYLDECLLIKPNLVIVNFARPIYEKFFQALTKKGIKIHVLDSEGAPFGRDDSHYKFYPLTVSKYIKYIQFYYLWGVDQYKLVLSFFRKMNIDAYEKIKITGSPMFDYHKFFLNNKKKRERRKKVVLINLGFALANPRFQKNFKVEIVNINKEINVSKKFAYMSYKSQKTLLLGFFKFLSKLSKELGDSYKIILNPHPFEDFNTYKNKFSNKKNVLILKQNNIANVLNFSDIIFSINCQTSVDSLLLNKPTFNLAFLSKKMKYSKVLSKASIQINSYKQCINTIYNYENIQKKYLKILINNKRFLSDFFTNFKFNSSKKILKIITSINYKKIIESNMFDFLNLIFRRGNLLESLKIFINYILITLDLKKNYLKAGFDKKKYEKEFLSYIKNISINRNRILSFKYYKYNLFGLVKFNLNSYELFLK